MHIFSVLRYYIPHVRAFKWVVLGTLFFYAMGVLLKDVVGALIYKRLFDTMGTFGANTADAVPMLSSLLIALVGAVFGYHILVRIADYFHPYAQSNIMKRLYDQAFSNIERHSYSFFANTFMGSLVTKTKRYVDSFETIHDIFVFQIWFHGISIVSAVTVLMIYAPLFAGIFVVWVALFIFGSSFFIQRIIARDTAHAASKSLTTGALADALTNILNIKMFARSENEKARFATRTAQEEHDRRHAWFMHTHQIVFQGLLIAGMELMSMFLAIKLWVAGDITLGTVVLIQTYLFLLFDVVWNIGRNITKFLNALADAQEAVEIFESPLHITDPALPEAVRMNKGALLFSNVSFAYNEKRVIFNNLSLAIPAGQHVGLVGHSGAGKTTITKLLLRFHDVTEGSITIDGQDIRAVAQDALRARIAYVPQESILFHRSLRENISYGKPDASFDEIVAVAKKAHAHEFIEKLTHGYDTLVGERGIKLSGGERQRIAIARAMLKDAPILILDEATSSLDSLSERYIQEGFDELMKGRTTLVIAHRLSTIVRMDRILVFDGGAIVEDGTHEELLKKNGVYAELWKEQSAGFIGE